MESSRENQKALVDARRERVTALVKEKWPTPLSPNQLLNAILDIIRGEAFAYEDVIEAIDALTEMHLQESRVWGKKHRFPHANNTPIGVNELGQDVYDPKDGHPPGPHYVDANGRYAALHLWQWQPKVVETRKLARRDAKIFALDHPNEPLIPSRTNWDVTSWENAPKHLHGILDILGEDALWRVYQTHLIESVMDHIPYGHPNREREGA